MTTTPAMTRDRIRTAERNAGVYDNGTHTGLIIATTVLLIPGDTENECDATLAARYGLTALNLVTDATPSGTPSGTHYAYTLETSVDLGDDHADDSQVIDQIKDVTPALGVTWSIFSDSLDLIATITL
ncbi:hypothetical protein [Corynebacterium timonense]|uniref:Uncharacterized protein n=1 Tax=Corynebacterium timonense TaxID=441500 RepID=A0A1H1LSM1_9CORY|nr:hypothetical protein [Corynebacterium timonense]SDR77370.1 hypothetical protein SAMN04488539_0318 [Corynebacterium timonense]